MAGPNPIIINFLTHGIDKVLKDMKSIQDVVLGTERKSTVAAKAGASDRDQIRAKEKAQAVKGAVNTAQQLVAAQKTGTKGIQKELAQSLQNQRKHLQDIKKQEDAHVNYARKLREQHFNNLHKVEKAGTKRSSSTEEAHLAYQKRLRQQHFEHLGQAGQAASRKADAQRKAEARRVESDAQKRIDHSVDVAKRLAQAEQKAHFEARRGGNADPKFSPQKQLQELRDAKHKSPEEQKAALHRVGLMREEAKLANAIRDKDLHEETKKQNKATKDFEQDQKKRAKIRDQHAAKADRAREHEERKAELRREHFNRTAGNVVTGVGRTVGRVASGAFNTMTDLGGGFSVGGALQEAVDLDRQAALIAVNSNVPGNQKVSAKKVKDTAKAAAIKTGLDATDVAGGLKAWQAKTGDFDAGARNLEFFGKASKVTGASMSDIMATMGQMTIQNKDLKGGPGTKSEGEMKKLLLSTIMQARQGAVDPVDLARTGAKVTRTAGMYTGNHAENQGKLIGLSQIGVRTAGNVSENATVLANIQADAINHKGAVKDLLGHDFQDDQGRIKGGPDAFIQDLFLSAMQKKGGLNNLANEGGDGKKLFGLRAQKYFQALEETYGPAKDRALGMGMNEKDAHAYAAKELNKDVTTTLSSNYSEADLQREYSEIMKNSAEKFEGAVRELKVGITDQLLPQLIQLIPVLKALTPVLASLIAFLGKLTGTDIGARQQASQEAISGASDAKGKLRVAREALAKEDTPENRAKLKEALAGAEEDKKNLGAATADREKAGKGVSAGRVFEQVVAGGLDAVTLGFAGQSRDLAAKKETVDPSEKKIVEEQKALYDELSKAIAIATAELKKVKGGDGGGSAPPAAAVPTAPVARR